MCAGISNLNDIGELQVRQLHLVAPLDKQFSLLYVLLKEHITEDVDYKVLCRVQKAPLSNILVEVFIRGLE